jgi:prevent-host-death family protein
MIHLSRHQARAQFDDVLRRVAFNGERIVIERNGRVLGVVVPAEDLVLLERARAILHTNSS